MFVVGGGRVRILPVIAEGGEFFVVVELDEEWELSEVVELKLRSLGFVDNGVRDGVRIYVKKVGVNSIVLATDLAVDLVLMIKRMQSSYNNATKC